MYQHETSIRVRYAETDQMGFVYYGNYAAYYEVGRVELIRSLGLSYKSLEERGIMLPVLEFKIKYLKPAKYDELLTIRTSIVEKPNARIHFLVEVLNENKDKLNFGTVSLVFVDAKTKKPCPAPDYFLQTIEKYF